MAQCILNFTVESTNEKLTPRAGEAVFGEFLKAIKIDQLTNKYLPSPQSNRGYDPYTFIHPLLLMLHSGGRYLEDVRMINSDKALCELVGIDKLPTADSIGKWLKRSTQKKVDGMEKLNRVLLRRYISRIDEPLVLDIDATVIESYKSIARTTYKMFPGFIVIGTLSTSNASSTRMDKWVAIAPVRGSIFLPRAMSTAKAFLTRSSLMSIFMKSPLGIFYPPRFQVCFSL